MMSGNGKNDDGGCIFGKGRTIPLLAEISSSFHSQGHHQQQHQSTPHNNKVCSFDCLSSEDILKLISVNPSLTSTVTTMLEKEVETKRLYLQAKAKSMYDVRAAVTQSLKQQSEIVHPNIVSFQLLSDLKGSETTIESISSQPFSNYPSPNSMWDQSTDQTCLRRQKRFEDSNNNLLLVGDSKPTSRRTVSFSSLPTKARSASLSWPKKQKKQDQHEGQKKEEYVDQPSDQDVVSGRGGFSNHHPGNKRYRQVIKDMKSQYKNIVSKSEKTDLSRSIVNYVYSYGGRFLRRVELYEDDDSGGESNHHQPHP